MIVFFHLIPWWQRDCSHRRMSGRDAQNMPPLTPRDHLRGTRMMMKNLRLEPNPRRVCAEYRYRGELEQDIGSADYRCVPSAELGYKRALS